MTPRILRLSDGSKAQLIEAGAGEAVFLLHGVGMQARVWEPQMTPLAARYRAIAVDMPGHGGSDLLPGTPALSDFVAWTRRVIEALGVGAVNLVGHSMGALIACGLAIEQPDQVRRLALLNAVHQRSPEARSAIQERARALARGEDGVDATLARWFGPGDDLPREKAAGWLRAVDQLGYANAYRVFAESDSVHAGLLSKIRCPTLVLTGEDDTNSTPSMTRLIAQAIPRARAVAIAGHRHMVALTAPQAVLQELTAWLEDKEEPVP